MTPFCDTVRASPLQLTCRQDQLAVAVCNLQRFKEELPLDYQVRTSSRAFTTCGNVQFKKKKERVEFSLFTCDRGVFFSFFFCVVQYFERIPDVSSDQLSFFGGAVEIADYCPFSQEFSWHLSGEYQRNSYCRLSQNQPGMPQKHPQMRTLTHTGTC